MDSKESLFVLAIRHALLLEDLPDGELPLSPAPPAERAKETVVDLLVPPHPPAMVGD